MSRALRLTATLLAAVFSPLASHLAAQDTVRVGIRYDTGVRPGRKTLNVQAGQTYSYTAAWSGGNLVLVRGH